jgi:hypothetical protein
LARFDTDRDAVGDDLDNCPVRPNTDQADSNLNGRGDVCEDSDADAIFDHVDNCPLLPNGAQTNSDGDGFGDSCDVCPLIADTSQSDADGDGLGDACDLDSDNDAFDDALDNCPAVANDQTDLDADGIGNVCDPDKDGDGIANNVDGRVFGASFVDQSELSSSNFTDQNLGGRSRGTIQSRGGLKLVIADSPNANKGLTVTAAPGSGVARIRQCDFRGRTATLNVLGGSAVELTCGSIDIETLANRSFLTLDDDVLIDIPPLTTASVFDSGSTDFAVQNSSASPLPVEIALAGDTQVTLSSDSVGHISEPVEGQYVIENDPTSAAPLVVEKDGVVMSYGPGARGLLVRIDIKPGSAANTINLNSNGVVPVAILSDESFDSTQLDPLSILLASSSVRLRGKGTPMTSIEDSNGDGRRDLVVHVETKDLALTSRAVSAVLIGRTFAGVDVIGRDQVIIVAQ